MIDALIGFWFGPALCFELVSILGTAMWLFTETWPMARRGSEEEHRRQRIAARWFLLAIFLDWMVPLALAGLLLRRVYKIAELPDIVLPFPKLLEPKVRTGLIEESSGAVSVVEDADVDGVGHVVDRAKIKD